MRIISFNSYYIQKMLDVNSTMLYLHIKTFFYSFHLKKKRYLFFILNHNKRVFSVIISAINVITLKTNQIKPLTGTNVYLKLSTSPTPSRKIHPASPRFHGSNFWGIWGIFVNMKWKKYFAVNVILDSIVRA